MELRVISHPLVDHKLTVLRNRNTEQLIFRRLVEELVTLLAYEATRGVRVHETAIETPVAPTVGTKLDSPAPLVVPILRAGLGMLDIVPEHTELYAHLYIPAVQQVLSSRKTRLSYVIRHIPIKNLDLLPAVSYQLQKRHWAGRNYRDWVWCPPIWRRATNLFIL